MIAAYESVSSLMNVAAEWMLKYNINLSAVDTHFLLYREYLIEKPWILHGDVRYCNKGNNDRHAEEDEFEWFFDKNILDKIEVTDEEYRGGRIDILGFHPYKEVAFLQLTHGRVVAYHLDGSKLGSRAS